MVNTLNNSTYLIHCSSFIDATWYIFEHLTSTEFL
jgi:hypothetical protein